MKNIVIVLVSCLILTGCGGSGGSHMVEGAAPVGAQGTNSFKAIQTQIFQSKCVKCHSPSNAKGAVDLSSYQSIMLKSGLIKPGEPTNSLIFKEVASGDMPLGGPSLSSDELQTLEDWINAGAPDGEFARSITSSIRFE